MQIVPIDVTIKFIDNPTDLETVFAIRREVFVDEQKVSPEEEFDIYEQYSRHFLGYLSTSPCGTARWRFTDDGIKLERFAVLKDFRDKNVGKKLLMAVLADIEKHPNAKNKLIYLHAQVHAVGFYEKYGFVKVGEMFEEANISHFKMKKA